MIKKIINRIFDIHPNAMSFREGLNLTGLPIITLQQNENFFNFILDTGSDISIIDSNILPSIEHEVLEGTDGCIYGIDGKRTVNKVCIITLSYKGKFYPADYHIRDMSVAFGNMKKDHGVTLHGLLGSQFFNTYKYVLDFGELIAYSKQ